MPMPQVPGPDEVEPTRVRLQRLLGSPAEDFGWDSPIEMRHVGPLSIEVERDPSLAADSNILWLRADGELPDDPLLHVCLMTYASDMTLLDTVLHAERVSWSDRTIVGASLDHAMWFHRPFRADEWLLYAQDSPSATGGRGLARGEVYTTAGQLVVSVVQEGLLRRRTR
jgi:acyl-CoA thioesterase-2